jgi:hypothetical protein
MTVTTNSTIMHIGNSNIIDPNDIVGDRWSYSLYIVGCLVKPDCEYIWRKIVGKSSICNIGQDCEITCNIGDLELLTLVISSLKLRDYLEYTYLIKRFETGLVSLYSDTISEYIGKKELIDYLSNVFL